MKATKYILYLSKTNSYFVNKSREDWPVKIITTYDIEKAKFYQSESGAKMGAIQLYDELPQIITVEIEIKPISMGEVITREAVEVKKKETLNNKYSKLQEDLLTNWNKEQNKV